MAEWREGVWIRPANLADLVEDPRCAWLDVRPESDPVELAGGLFDPAGWGRNAERLLARLAVATHAMRVDPEAAMVTAFLAGAASLHHIRSDPLLPDALLPDPWPGRALRDAYRAYQREFTAAARAWFRT
jgi:phenylacetic acid degradation operon negative regulatory protein